MTTLAWAASLSLKVAPVAAPRAFLHRILVLLRCSWWFLVLADAVCWGLTVEEVRSDPHDRVGSLGFFVKGIAIAHYLVHWAASATFALVSSPARCPPRPRGNMSVALPIAREAAQLAVSCLTIAVWRRPMARALMRT